MSTLDHATGMRAGIPLPAVSILSHPATITSGPATITTIGRPSAIIGRAHPAGTTKSGPLVPAIR
eukprot:1878701-Heterocapsa_arctica.AAC.1